MISNLKKQRVAKRFSLKNRSWNYRGEGNANLVLALLEDRIIIRLRKSLPTDKRREDRIWLEVDFCEGIMLPLLGTRFVHVPAVVRLPDSELAHLNDILLSCRPPSRHAKGLHTRNAALLPDLCLLPSSPSYHPPTFCVEIKPKQGWIPLPDRRLPKCTFCLNQYYKLNQGFIKRISGYCPLDLFSGNHDRMKRAIRALLHCPQNNLKMFNNGKLVYDDSTDGRLESVLEEWFGFTGLDSLTDNLTSMVMDALLSELTESDEEKRIPDWRHEARKVGSIGAGAPRVAKHLLEEARALLPGPSCYKESQPLPRNCILGRILQLQKLDMVGSEEVYRVYQGVQKREEFAYVYEMLVSPRKLLQPVNGYLVATTAKDCSILMSFQRSHPCLGEGLVRDLKGVCYKFNVGVSDLDPKPASFIEKHRKRDEDVVVSCIEILRSQNALKTPNV